MFENLTDRLEGAFKTLKGKGKITEVNIASTVKEIRRALVEADVNFKIAKEFTATVKDKAIGENVLNAVQPGQLMVKIVQDELTDLMGGQAAELEFQGSPSIILMAGLQGSGKTTHSIKLANHLKTKRGKKPLLVAGDVYRPAAINQLQILGEQIGVEVYAEVENKNPVEIAQNALAHAKAKNFDTLIVDTAGRLAIDEAMMNEIKALHSELNPAETLFVVDAMTGQDAVNTAKAFNDLLDFTGVILTKMDGDTRGGAALSIKYTVNKPIKFIGLGEKPDALEVFYPDRLASRILGMGDIVSLVEKAQQDFDEKKAQKLQNKLQKNKFDFNDFLEQLKQIQKMGNIKDVMSMIPGVGNKLKDIDIDEHQFKKLEAIILSMTPQERSNPDLINSARKGRLAKGSGNTIQEVNQFMKNFGDMRKMMKNMNKMGMFGNKMPNIPGLK